ncbi:hypothetical protein C7974DRAFT_380821 [Boeremia exigua]|uniref:uncharacterized protein n=1 Tax=Boeremia exigua TaxID=749465 RepID=UPI001E8E6941|nr:uncharacterized protein C7974DRAFT_380821 [Boeremia exigua]KAH6613110.1 hypothetical protein C7974DRAFT_380821 [Boeremia exigua]
MPAAGSDGIAITGSSIESILMVVHNWPVLWMLVIFWRLLRWSLQFGLTLIYNRTSDCNNKLSRDVTALKDGFEGQSSAGSSEFSLDNQLNPHDVKKTRRENATLRQYKAGIRRCIVGNQSSAAQVL